MNNTRHYIAAITAFVIWGFFAIPLRALSEYSSGEILYFRILFSLLVLLVIIFGFKGNDLRNDFVFLKNFSPQEQYKIAALTLVGGALLIVNWLTFIYIVNHINIKTASFSYMICPVLTAVMGYLLLKERLTGLQWFAVGLCAISCVFLGIHSALELGYSFLTALSYAFYIVSQRRNQGFDRMIILGIQVLFSFLILNIFYSSLMQEVPVTLEFYTIMLFIAMVFTVLPMFLSLYALNRINSATLGILLYLHPIVNFAVAFVVFKETVSLLQVVGYSIIVVALVLFNYPIFRRLQDAMTEKFAKKYS